MYMCVFMVLRNAVNMEARTSVPRLSSLCILSVLLVVSKAFIQRNREEEQEDVLSRSQFPEGFLFGVATSAYQIEGAILEDGKSLSNWDVFVRVKGNVKNGDTGDIADDHYHRYLEDIEIIHSLGVDAYRFSISWTRILPRGKYGDVNPAGIMFYNKIIDTLLLKGIKPFVTIHHSDYPEELEQRYGGWLSPLMQEDFAYFAEICFENFGDRVKHWTTINEPNVMSQFGYMFGTQPPGHCSPPFGNCSAGNSDIEPLISMHNMLLAHAKAVKIYRDRFQSEESGVIGIVVHAIMFEPLTNGDHDKEAASRALAFNIAWVLDPIIFGEYPPEMRHFLGNELPRFTSMEAELIKDSTDFLGINHYGTLYAQDYLYSRRVCSDIFCSIAAEHPILGFVQSTPLRDGILIGEPTGKSYFFVVPRGIEGVVEYAKKRYNNKPIFILENGYSSPLKQVGSTDLEDVNRIDYHKKYLNFLLGAIRNGADVRGYFIWTLMDNFEWSDGYGPKFGLYSIDPLTLNRIPRQSAKWYKNLLKTENVEKSKPETAISFPMEDALLQDIYISDGRAGM